MNKPLRQYEYGDPLKILIAREATTCKGCVYEIGKISLGNTVLLCAKLHVMTKRCKDYQCSEAWKQFYRSRTSGEPPQE